MNDHITPQQPGTPALDYEAVKDYFFEKLAADRHGRGRMESAQYHTVQWVFLQGCHERDKLLARIAELEDEVANLPCDAHCAALGEREFMRAQIEDEMKRWKPAWQSVPDYCVSVMIATDDGEVWIGHHDGEDWFDSATATCVPNVTHWMDFPRGPHDDA